MMASTVADNASTTAAPLSVNSSRNLLRLRARAPMIASAYNYRQTALGAVIKRDNPAEFVRAITKRITDCRQKPSGFNTEAGPPQD